MIRKEVKNDGSFGGNYPYDIEYANLPDKLIDITGQQRDEIDSNPDKYRYINNQITINPGYEAIKFNNSKILKLQENITKRNEYLLSGVEYQGVLFDSDLEQKINIMATVNSMSDSDVITWYGMDNESLDCTKEDLINIGGLLTFVTSRVWAELNPSYINAINNAQTIEDLDDIIIDYEAI